MGENQDLTSCLLLSVFPPAGPSPLQAPLPGSGVAVFNSTLVQPACAGWEGQGWGAGSPFSLPHTFRPNHLRIMRSRWPLASLDPRWLQGPPPAREQLMTTRGWKVKPPFADKAVQPTLRPPGGRRAGVLPSQWGSSLSALGSLASLPYPRLSTQ